MINVFQKINKKVLSMENSQKMYECSKKKNFNII